MKGLNQTNHLIPLKQVDNINYITLISKTNELLTYYTYNKKNI